MAKIFAVGDIHGCYDELMALMAKMPINPEEDQVIFVGDYIDRGPDTKKVVQQLIDWQKQYPHWKFLYGNHEDLMLDALVYKGRKYHSYDLWYQQGGKQTFKSYLPEGLSDYEKAIIRPEDVIPLEHLEFLMTLKRYYESELYYFVHGGLVPHQFPDESDEMELIWIRDEFIQSDYDWGKKVIFGHSCAKNFQPIVMPNKIGIDTAVCPGANARLTAVELPAEVFYQEESHYAQKEKVKQFKNI